jgi:hypothetical protein
VSRLKLQIALCAAFLVANVVSWADSAPAVPEPSVGPSLAVSLTEPPRFPLRSELPAPEPTVYAYPTAGVAIDTSDREAVRVFYRGLYSQSENVAINWTGDHSACNAGTTDSLYQSAVALRVNWFRAMAGVPATVSFYGPYSQQDQPAALVMSVNNSLSHTPPNTWNCWSQTAYDAAGKSNIALGYFGANAVTGYMLDNGTNNAPVGHRRWVLYPQTQNMGTGDVPRGSFNGSNVSPANALWTIDSHTYDARPSVRDDFVAWPPKGYVPHQVVFGRWSLAHSQADFSNASVTVSKAGVNVPVSVEVLHNGYGENTIVWLLQGTNDSTVWPKPAADETYSVTVANAVLKGVSRTFSYNVTVFDPNTATPNAPQTTVNAPTGATASSAFPVSLTPMPQASAYDLALYRLVNLTGIAPADSPSPWSYVTGPTNAYNPIEATAFHLYHSNFANQSLTLNKKLHLEPNASLSFQRWFTWAAAGQVARVQISLDDTATWQDVYTEVGSNNVAAATKLIDLAPFAGRSVRLKFEFSYLPGLSAYPQPETGWFFNNIAFTNVSELVEGQSATLVVTQTDTSFTVPTPGRYAIAGRTEYQGSYYTDWGLASAFQVGAATTTTTTSTTTTTATTTTTSSTTTTTLAGPTLSLQVAPGWNLLGNSLSQPISVVSVFGDPVSVTTVWKWDVATSGWQFYAPSMTAAALQTYVASKGYGVLSVINPGEGYWVNAKVAASPPSQTGTAFALTSANLVTGWNLVATGNDVTPSAFNTSLSATPPSPGVIPINLTTLWAWDNPLSQWYFYAPTLEASGGLAGYITGKGYLDFMQRAKTLGNGVGFWVNRP